MSNLFYAIMLFPLAITGTLFSLLIIMTASLHLPGNNILQNTTKQDFYEMYADIIFGAINVFTNDNSLSEAILQDFFLSFDFKELTNDKASKPIIKIYKCSIAFTIQYMKKSGMSPDTGKLKDCPKILRLIYESLESKESLDNAFYYTPVIPAQKIKYAWLPIFGNDTYFLKRLR